MILVRFLHLKFLHSPQVWQELQIHRTSETLHCIIIEGRQITRRAGIL
jgi:hypothetical protein